MSVNQLWSYGGVIALGNVAGITRFYNGSSRASSGFVGSLNRLQIYNRALDNTEVAELSMSFDEAIM